MRSFVATSAAVLATVASVSAQADHLVTVGQNGLTFTPNQINAAVGDTVTFAYYPKNHTVTQSSFTAPCTPLQNATTGATGFDSGFVPVGPNGTEFPTYTVKLTVNTPIWVYCKQATHCQEGMVFAINPTANKTFDAFLATAKALASNTTMPAGGAPGGAPGGAYGGASGGAGGSSAAAGGAAGSAAAGGSVGSATAGAAGASASPSAGTGQAEQSTSGTTSGATAKVASSGLALAVAAVSVLFF